MLCGEDAWFSSAATYVSCALASGAQLSNSPDIRHRQRAFVPFITVCIGLLATAFKASACASGLWFDEVLC